MRLSLPFHENMCESSSSTTADIILSSLATDLESMNRIALWPVEGLGKYFVLSIT